MTGFHPGVRGILYGALAQHEQQLAMMQVAAGMGRGEVDDEAAERYAAIVDGLKRMIKAAEPSGYDASTMGVTEEMLRRHALLGNILSQLLDFKVGSCSISPYYGQGIQINMPFTHKSPEVDARVAMRQIAERLDLQYSERRHGSSSSTLHISAEGTIHDVEVDIYELITAERPFCDIHDQMVDVDGVCRSCLAERAAEVQPELGAQGSDDGGALNSSGRDIAEEAWQQAEAEREGLAELAVAEEYDPDDPDHVADSDGTGRYTEDQFAGYACAGCGNGFGAEPRVRVGHTFPGGGVVTDLGMSAHQDCIDSSIPELGDAP